MKLKDLKFSSLVGSLAIAVGLMTSVQASAATPFPAGGTLQANVEYVLSQDNVYATFLPTKTEEVTYTCGNMINPYSDPDHTVEMDKSVQNYLNFTTYSLQVEEGVPVYFYVYDDPSWYGAPIFKITSGQPIEFLSCSEEEGSVLSLTSGISDLTISFNQPVKAANAYLLANSVMRPATIIADELSGSDYGMNININYLAPLQELFNSNILHGGENIKIILSGIENAAEEKYEGENGAADLVLNFKAPAKPVTLEELIVPDVFDGNWTKGDPNALLTATYSGNISRAQYTLTYGLDPNSTMPQYYEEVGASDDPSSKSPVTIEGNKVSVDFSTAKRSPQDMDGFESDEIYVKITAWDESGQPVVGEGQGSVGSKEVLIPYICTRVAAFNPVYTPASGTSLSGVKELKLQYEDYMSINFTGIDFIITDGETINVPVSETTHEILGDSKWSVVYTIPVPEAAQKADTNVRVKLTGVTSLANLSEGFADEFDAIYFPKQLEITEDFTVTPAAGTVEELLDFEVSREGYEVSVVADGTSLIVLSITENGQVEDIKLFGISDVTIESGVAKFSLPVAFSEPGDYTLTIPEGFFSFNSDSAESMLNGMREVSYKIEESDPVELPVNSMYFVNPEEGDVENLSDFEIGCQNYVTSITEDQNQKIVLNRVENEEQTLIEEFTKDSITIENGTAKFSLSTPLTEDGFYELLIPEGFFTFTNESLDSKMLNSGREITYRIASIAENLEYEATPTPGIVSKLSEISLYFPNGAGLGEGSPQLLIDDQDPINLNGELSLPEDLTDTSSTIKFTLPQEYTTNGKYVLLLPNGYVRDANGNATGEYRLEYTLDKATGIWVPVISGDKVEVYSIDGVKVIEGGSLDVLKTLPRGLYIINGKKVIL